MRKLVFLSPLLFIILNLSAAKYPKHEMRAVWIATIANIDWPSSPGLSSAQQQKEFIELLDLSKAYHMNTVVFQIRPASDAFYASKFEPWSQWLTGEQGKEPDPYYDPLAFATTECHKRGIDLHVWINPYRAVSDISNNRTSPNHISNSHPEWFVTYGKTKLFDPGLPQTRNYVAKIVSDIVCRYDIDAIHMDDYFYPYRIAGVEFPDDKTFRDYPDGFLVNQRDDWRRHNVDLIIKQIHDSIRSIKPWVEFGISPFGVWRNADKDPTGSKTKAGQTNYDDLYADILKWERSGWIDYVTPQVYWEIGKEIADYDVITDWWSRNNYGTQLFIGQALYKLNPEAKERSWQSADEIINQVKLNRRHSAISGTLFYSAKFLRKNPLDLKDKLQRRYYRYPALIPANDRIAPLIPVEPLDAQITVSDGQLRFTWEKRGNTKSFVIYQFNRWQRINIKKAARIFLTTSDNSVTYLNSKFTNPDRYRYVVTAISPTNSESNPVKFYQQN